MCSKRKKLSLEREVLLKIWTSFCGLIEKLISGNFRCGVHTEIFGVCKVKNRKKFQSGSAKGSWT